MQTRHQVVFSDSRDMKEAPDESADLMVTSPPYPMIEMWDEIFGSQNAEIAKALKKGDGDAAFELMHRVLDDVWKEVWRVLKPGAVACINVGDATRTVNGRFSLFTNHSRIQYRMQKLGFSSLPAILWRKQTNAPNKFMGSGMLPPGAYVTLEHEYVLIFRKGDKKLFPSAGLKQLRRESAYFWEERNMWFSDVWMDLKGVGQERLEKKARDRSGAFPFELAYRLICMFSTKQDLVLEPFLGTGTTMLAAMATARNSMGFEIDPCLKDTISSSVSGVVPLSRKRIQDRLSGHMEFVKQRFLDKGPFKYRNKRYGFPVVTAQEQELFIDFPEFVETAEKENAYRVRYGDGPMERFACDWTDCFKPRESGRPERKTGEKPKKHRQASMFD